MGQIESRDLGDALGPYLARIESQYREALDSEPIDVWSMFVDDDLAELGLMRGKRIRLHRGRGARADPVVQIDSGAAYYGWITALGDSQ